MISPSTPSVGLKPSDRKITTLLFTSWGFVYSYFFFRSLLNAPSLRATLTALLPLIVVWAAMHRKRWGRLALLWLSALALTLFSLTFAWLLYAERTSSADNTISAQYQLFHSLRLLADYPRIGMTVLVLALITSLWLRRDGVKKEFDSGKKSSLSKSQTIIAFVFVLLWGLTMIFSPVISEANSGLLKRSIIPPVNRHTLPAVINQPVPVSVEHQKPHHSARRLHK